MIKAIVYTSNSGYTAEYARLLGQKTGLPVHSLNESKRSLADGTEIFYLGWLMAGGIKGYKKAAQRYQVRAVAAVGLGGSGTRLAEVRKVNALPEGLSLFTLQGGFDLKRLHGLHKFIMSSMSKTLSKSLAEKPDRTPEETATLDMLLHGGSCVSTESLQVVCDWYKKESGIGA